MSKERFRAGRRPGGIAAGGYALLKGLLCVSVALLLGSAVGLLVLSPRPEARPQDVVRITYEGTRANFPNPERGFHRNVDLVNGGDFSWIRNRGYTLARSYVRLDDYRNRPLPASLLRDLEAGLRASREAGIKVIPRFSYNFPEDVDGGDAPDAPLPRVLQHVRQLRPVFADNRDVIAVHQASFIGAWGEWHSSSNGLDSPKNKRIILGALLDAVPETRTVQLRYPADLMDVYPSPLTAGEAFTGTDQARTGHHNDCFLANEHDAGTYLPLRTKAARQRYLERMGWYVPVGGETCQVTPEVDRTDCPTALGEMERFHWSYINRDFYAPAIAGWQQEGCYGTIAKRLGYRFRLVRAAIPEDTKAGGTLSMRFVVKNDGFASPYNPRKVELVLRNRKTEKETKLRLNADPRRWMPGPARTFSIQRRIPTELRPGAYDLFLNLPDPEPRLYGRPEYSIRFANAGLWEPETGYNKLKAGLRVR